MTHSATVKSNVIDFLQTIEDIITQFFFLTRDGCPIAIEFFYRILCLGLVLLYSRLLRDLCDSGT